MRKILAFTIILLLLNPIPYMHVSADRVTGELETKASSSSNISIDGDGNVSGGGSSNSSGGNSGGGSGGGSGGSGGSGGGSGGININVSAEATIINGREVEISAHLLESIQGLNRGTYVPKLEDSLSEFSYENKHAALTESRFFGEGNKRDSVFGQDGKFSLDYVEALNWLYKNNLIQEFENTNFKFKLDEDNESIGELVAENGASGGEQEYVLKLTLPSGPYVLQYDMYTVPDKIKILDSKGKEIQSTGGEVSGQGKLEFDLGLKKKGSKDKDKTEEGSTEETETGTGKESEEGKDDKADNGKSYDKGEHTITIITNEGNGQEGTLWDYSVYKLDGSTYGVRNITDVNLTELPDKDSWLYPIAKDKYDKTIKKKDYIMQLMKVVDGVEESRPLVFESQYEYMDLDGKRMRKTGVELALNTIYKDKIGATGIDLAINDVDVEFNKYAMSKYYVNPNVYELYLDKAYNSGVISKKEIKDKTLLKYLDKNQRFGYEEVPVYTGEDEDEEDADTEKESEEVSKSNSNSESKTVGFVGKTIYSLKKIYDNNSVVNFINIFKPLHAEARENIGGNTGGNSSNGVTTPPVSNGEEEEEDEDAKKPLSKTNKSSETEVRLKLGTELPNWHNSLPSFRLNHIRNINNNGEYNVDNSVGIFGSSWSNPAQGVSKSKTELSGSFTYNPDYQYFVNEDISYVDAVVYTYKAINAYADEKLSQREVDTIMSMYSVNYGNLNKEEKTALNYLIAKGIIDGDNSAKYTSIENITVEDAIVMMYRVANPSARLTFKTVFETTDESMLDMGYGQSKVGLNTYSSTLPEMEVVSTKPTEYYVIMNKAFTGANYGLGSVKFKKLKDPKIKMVTQTYTSKQLAELGLNIAEGKYLVHKYSVPWDYEVEKLGYTLNKSRKDRPDWIEMEPGGGFYLIDEALMNGDYREVKFTRFEPSFGNSDEEINPDNTGGEGSIIDNGNKPQEDSGSDLQKDTPADDNDPLDILSMATPEKETIHMKRYMNDGNSKEEKTKIYVGINSKAKSYLLFDGKQLFVGGELNPDLVSIDKDIETIKALEQVPTDKEGKAISNDGTKTFLEFTFPSTNKRTSEDLKSLIKRRLTLTGKAEVENEDIASYTGLSNGQTMISGKELSRFGITTSKEEPDILYHGKSDTYAYLNTQTNVALISNTVMKFPENGLMIEVTADDIYYNIKVVMSMLNDSDFYIFNEEGKYEIVKKLDDLQERIIASPVTDKRLDLTYTGTVKSYSSEGSKDIVSKGSYINISAISNTPATFFMSINKREDKDKKIYGFSPYYVKTPPSSKKTGTTAGQIIQDLQLETSDIIYVENLLINNSILRQEFSIPKNDTFVYTDNAIKVTNLTKSKDYGYYAESYLDFISSLYKNMSEKDVRSEALIFKESNSLFKNQNFKMSDLLDRSLYENKDDKNLQKLITNVRNGVDTEAFWVLYFLNKFSINYPYEKGTTESASKDKFDKELIEAFNSKYTFRSGWKPSSAKDLELLKVIYASDTDIMDRRLYSFKRMYSTPNKGFISTDDEIFINRNDAMYLKLKDFTSKSTAMLPKTNVTSDSKKTTIDMPFYLANNNGALTEAQTNALQSQKDILGTAFYTKGNNLYSPNLQQYKTLPSGQSPLESHPNGTVFEMESSYGKEKFILVNKMVTTANGNITAKIAKVNTVPLSIKTSVTGKTEGDKLYAFHTDPKVYSGSIATLGTFSSTVNKNAKPIERAIRSDEIISLSSGTSVNPFYFDYGKKNNSTNYVFLTDVHAGKNGSSFMQARSRDVKSYSVGGRVTSTDEKLIFNTSKTKFTEIKPKLPGVTGPNGVLGNNQQATEYMVYESYLVDYGTISLSVENKASLNVRTDYALNSSPVLTDLVDELVKAVKSERVGLKKVTVGDLVSGDKLVLADGTASPETLSVIKTSDKAHKGYAHFISGHPMNDSATPKDLEYAGTLLLKNYSIMDSNKINVGGERRSLYYFIGNKELNLAKASDLTKYGTQLEYPSLGASNVVLVENTDSSGKVKTRKYSFSTSATNQAISNGKVSELTDGDANKSFKYFLSIYLDSNLLVRKNTQGFYEIIGYANDNLINTEAFTSRASRFTGVFDSLLTVLPTYSSVEGKFLGFDLSKLEVESLKNLFTLKYWSDLVKYIVLNIEQILSGLGIYYVYLLMVMVLFSRTMPEVFYRFFFNPVRLLTLGKLDVENIELKSFIPKCIFAVVMLTLTYSGFIRVILLKAEDIRIAVIELVKYPFL